MREVLLDLGVRLVGDDASTVAGPEDAAVTIPESSVAELATQAAEHTGDLGADLDALGGGAPIALPPSALLAAYARGGKSNAAEIARAALEGQDLTDPQGSVFPALTMVLFAADAAHAFDPERTAGSDEASAEPQSLQGEVGTGPVAQAAAAYSVPAFKPCSLFSDAVFGTINRVFDALKIPPIQIPDTGIEFVNWIVQGLVNVVVEGINIVIEGLRTIVINTVKFLLADIVDLIAKAASVVALVGTVIANFRPVSLRLAPDDDSVTRGTAPVRERLLMTSHVDGMAEFSDTMQDCAVVATGHRLPPLKPVGAPVTWDLHAFPGGIDLAHEVSKGTDHAMRDLPGTNDTEAAFFFETGVESPKKQEEQEQQGVARVVGGMGNKIVEDLRKMLVEMAEAALSTITSKLPEPFAGFVQGLLRDAAESATTSLASTIEVKRSASVTVVYHDGKKDKPTPTPSPSGGPVSLEVDATFHTPFGFISTLTFKVKACAGATGPWVGTLRTTHPPATSLDPAFDRTWKVSFTFDAKGLAKLSIPEHPDVIAGNTHTERFYVVFELAKDHLSMTPVAFVGFEDGSEAIPLLDRLSVGRKALRFRSSC